MMMMMAVTGMRIRGGAGGLLGKGLAGQTGEGGQTGGLKQIATFHEGLLGWVLCGQVYGKGRQL